MKWTKIGDVMKLFPHLKGGTRSLLVIVLAFVAKIFSTFLVAYFVNKMSARDGVALGLLMNTKGLLSLIIINAGRDLLVRAYVIVCWFSFN